jgi:hypothetical protein
VQPTYSQDFKRKLVQRAERLLESLEGHGSAGLSPAWREEVRRRREEIERGEVEAVPAEVVLGRMRAMLA